MSTRRERDGLGPVAILALICGVTGIGAVSGPLVQARLSAVSAAPYAAYDSVENGADTDDASSVLRPTRIATTPSDGGPGGGEPGDREPGIDRLGSVSAKLGSPPLRPEPVTRDWPRLKPRPLRSGDLVLKATAFGDAMLADAAPAAIVAAEDVTGGKESLFADYRETRAAVIEEQSYRGLVVPRGGSVVDALRAEGLSAREASAAMMALKTGGADLADDAITIELATEALPLTVSQVAAGEHPYRLARLRTLSEDGVLTTAWANGTAWHVRGEAPEVQTRYAAAAATIPDSLFGAGRRAGVPYEVMARMANLFLYDVDFVRDIRRGDRFEVVYEVLHDQRGRPLGTGEVVFAALSWRGGAEAKSYYRSEADGEVGYFDAEGRSAKRLLMKTPIEGARVTSRFGKRRHPTLGYTKQHKGVDFGAQSGTPVMAAGDGTVMRADRFGSYGNYVRIRHAGGYETAYAHLKGFAKGVRKGAKIRQGEVVAYVGSTGRSTGPHLHYEVLQRQVAVNPMTIDVANGRVLEGEALNAFAADRVKADGLRSYPFAVAAVAAAAD